MDVQVELTGLITAAVGGTFFLVRVIRKYRQKPQPVITPEPPLAAAAEPPARQEEEFEFTDGLAARAQWAVRRPKAPAVGVLLVVIDARVALQGPTQFPNGAGGLVASFPDIGSRIANLLEEVLTEYRLQTMGGRLR